MNSENNQNFNGNYNNSIYPDDGYIVGYEISVVLGFKYTACVLSFIGSLFIIICYLYLIYLVKCKSRIKTNSNNSNQENSNNSTNMKEYKQLKMGYGHDLIFLLAISDFILSISAFIKTSDFNSKEISANCIAQGVIMNFAEISSICWTSIIAYSIYLSTKTTGTNLVPKYYLYFFIYSYGFPILLTFIPLFTKAYGPAGAWCWFNTKNLENNTAWIWSLVVYIFNWANIIFNIFAITKSLNYFRIRTFEIREDHIEEANFLKNFCIVLKFFPIILVVCWMPATINRIYLFFSGIENTFLYTIHSFFANLTGFLNCLVYSYYYKNLIRLWFCGGNASNNNSANQVELSKMRNEDNKNYEKNITIPSQDEKDREKGNEDL